MTVLVRYHNGACITTRELVDADRCPKCGALAFDVLCKRADHEGSHAPVRCKLCETEYATVVSRKHYRTGCEYWGTGDKLQASIDAGLESARRAQADIDALNIPPLAHNLWRDVAQRARANEDNRSFAEKQKAERAMAEAHRHAERSKAVRAFFGLEPGELADRYAGRIVFDGAPVTKPRKRSLRQRVWGALRGAARGWRGE